MHEGRDVLWSVTSTQDDGLSLAQQVAAIVRCAVAADGRGASEIAEALGVSQVRVSQFTKEGVRLHLDSVARYLHVLGYDVQVTVSRAL